MMTVRHVIDLPFPPSVNSMYRAVKGRSILSEDYRKWKTEADKLGLIQRIGKLPMLKGEFKAEIAFSEDAGRYPKRDLDNHIKPILDWAQKNSLIMNDKYCRQLTVWWTEYGDEEAPEGCRLILRGVSQGRAA